MRQKEQLAKLVLRLNEDDAYMSSEAVEAAFLLGARARDRQILSYFTSQSGEVDDEARATLEAMDARKPEELL